MIKKAQNQLKADGFIDKTISMEWSIDLRYARQVHEVTTLIKGVTPLNKDSMNLLIKHFEELYERRYGKGSAYRDAGIEMTMFRLTAKGLVERPSVERLPINSKDYSEAIIDNRKIFVDLRNGLKESPVLDFDKILPGNAFSGPVLIHTPITTIVIQEGQTGHMDDLKNIIIEFD